MGDVGGERLLIERYIGPGSAACRIEGLQCRFDGLRRCRELGRAAQPIEKDPRERGRLSHAPIWARAALIFYIAIACEASMGCVSEDDLLDYVERRLPLEHLAETEAHLRVCDDCRRLLAEVAPRAPRAADELLGRYEVLRTVGAGGM